MARSEVNRRQAVKMGLLGTLALAFSGAVGTVGYYGWNKFASDTTVQENSDTADTGQQIAEQKSAGFFKADAGRTYVIWRGTVIEELDNNTGFSDHKTDYDMNVYDFELGAIFHTSNELGGLARTLFTELVIEGQNGPRLPQHLFHVRDIGCTVAQGYLDRAKTPEYGEPPADVTAFHEKHCITRATGLDLIP